MGKITFIIHGKIRSRRKVMSEIEQVFKGSHTLEFIQTKAPRDAEGLAREAIASGCDYLIAVGGDGTLNEVVNGYLTSKAEPSSKPILGVLPFGTGNDFARGSGIRRCTHQLEELIKLKSVKKVDAGLLKLTGKDEQRIERYFDNIADLGLGAEVVARVNGVHLRKKILGGTLTFFISVLLTFLSYRHKMLKVKGDDFEWTGSILGLVVANGRYFGSGLGIAPEARLDDGLFEVIILGKVSILDYLKNFSRLRRCEKIEHPEVFYYKSSKVWAEPVDKRLVAEADGETEGAAPVEFICLTGALPFLMPLAVPETL